MEKSKQRKTTKKGILKPKQIKFLKLYIKNLGHITNACKEVDIERSTYYDWMKDEFFLEKFNDSNEHFNDSVMRRILSFALKNDKDMLKFWAKTQMKHRGFIENQRLEIEHSGSLNPTEIQIIMPNETTNKTNNKTG